MLETRFRDDATLDLSGLDLENVSALSRLTGVRRLILHDNLISDLSPLTGLTGLRLLDLSANTISSIGPLVDRDIWLDDDAIGSARLRLQRNPLDAASVAEDVATLRSWGVRVQIDYAPDDEDPVAVPDPVLEALIARNISANSVFVDMTITKGSIAELTTLRAHRAGLSDLTGLEAAANLRYLFAGSNNLVDLAPLSELPDLEGIDLSDNDIADIAPLVENRHLGRDDWIVLDGNPLSEEAVNVQIPALLKRGVSVHFDGIRLTATSRGDPVDFEVAGHFAAMLGEDTSTSVKVRDAGLAFAEIVDGDLTVRPGPSGGRVRVTVAATDADARTATLTFSITLRGAVAVSTFPPAADPVRQGFMRVINPTVEAERLRIDAFDRNGTRRGPATLTVGPGSSAQFNLGRSRGRQPRQGPLRPRRAGGRRLATRLLGQSRCPGTVLHPHHRRLRHDDARTRPADSGRTPGGVLQPGLQPEPGEPATSREPLR